MKSVIPSVFRAIVLTATVLLGGCDVESVLKLPNVAAALKGDREARQAVFTTLTANPTANVGQMDTLINMAYGAELIYLPDGWRSMITRDPESVLALVVGVYISRTNTSFAYANSLNPDIDEASFNRYKTFGDNWRRSIANDPMNSYLKERLELFKARTGTNYDEGMQNWAAARLLLRNDTQFREFLTSDTFASQWLARNMNPGGFSKEIHAFDFLNTLGPINTGALPNASP